MVSASSAAALGGLGVPIRPGLVIQAIHGEELDLPGFDPGPDVIEHVEVFEFVEAPALAGEDDDGFAGMPDR